MAPHAQPTVSQRLARYIVEEKLDNIDAATIARVKHIIAYNVSHALRGLKDKETDSMRAIDVARELSEGGGRSSLIGLPDKLTPVDAVFVNCQLMRAFGLDDVIFETGIHPGLMTIPVALGLAERHRSSGAETIVAIVVGYEMLGKFARWSWSLDMPRRATMPFGPFGALATAARLLGLDEGQTSVAMAYAAHGAMGLAESDLGPISHYYGLVCRNSLIGAYLSKAGAWGSPTVIEGRFGFSEAFLGKSALDEEALFASLGHDYAILQACEKRYPGTGLNQLPIEMTRELVKEQGLRATDIAAIEVELPSERENFGGGHSLGPFLPETAPSSCAYQMAIMLLDGDLDFRRYAQVDNPEILELVARTQIRFVEEKPIRYARLVFHTRDGRVLVKEGDEFFFEPETPHDMIAREADGLLPEHKVARFVELLDDLETVEDASELMVNLVP